MKNLMNQKPTAKFIRASDPDVLCNRIHETTIYLHVNDENILEGDSCDMRGCTLTLAAKEDKKANGNPRTDFVSLTFNVSNENINQFNYPYPLHEPKLKVKALLTDEGRRYIENNDSEHVKPLGPTTLKFKAFIYPRGLKNTHGMNYEPKRPAPGQRPTSRHSEINTHFRSGGWTIFLKRMGKKYVPHTRRNRNRLLERDYPESIRIPLQQMIKQKSARLIEA